MEPESTIAREVTRKLEEGDYKGAVRRLSSEETIATDVEATLSALCTKHSLPPLDRRTPPQPSPCVPPLLVGSQAVHKAVFSFPPGSSGGPDGLTPQHLKDLIRSEGEEAHCYWH